MLCEDRYLRTSRYCRKPICIYKTAWCGYLGNSSSCTESCREEAGVVVRFRNGKGAPELGGQKPNPEGAIAVGAGGTCSGNTSI